MHIPIRTSTIRPDQKLYFDVFLKINKKYICYIKKDDIFEDEKLTKLRTKKVKKVFIQEEEEDNYRSYLDTSIKTMTDAGISEELKADFIHGVATDTVENIFEAPTDETKVEFMKNVLGTQLEFMKTNQFALKHLMKLENFDFNIYHHSMNVTHLSVALGMKLVNEITPNLLEILAMGASLHDIGKTQIALHSSVFPETLSKEKLELYKQHPQKGVDIVISNAKVNPKVRELIFTHEEKADGSGYPQGLGGAKLDILSQVISLVNTYDRFVTFKKMSPKETWKEITLNNVGVYDLNLINILQTILKEQGLL